MTGRQKLGINSKPLQNTVMKKIFEIERFKRNAIFDLQELCMTKTVVLWVSNLGAATFQIKNR